MSALQVRAADGPAHAIASRPGMGLTSLRPWELRLPASALAVHRATLDTTLGGSVTIAPGDELRYAVLPGVPR